MKAQMKAVMASAVVIVLALAAVSGVTYSWFSDTEEVDVNITTGGIDLEIKQVEVSEYLHFGTDVASSNDNGVNLGTRNDNGQPRFEITISNMAPNDVLKLNFSGTLLNTIPSILLFNTDIIIPDALASPFEISNIFYINNEEYRDVIEASNVEKTIKSDLTIRMDNVGNEYQNKTFKIVLNFSAYQSNAPSSDYPQNSLINSVKADITGPGTIVVPTAPDSNISDVSVTFGSNASGNDVTVSAISGATNEDASYVAAMEEFGSILGGVNVTGVSNATGSTVKFSLQGNYTENMLAIYHKGVKLTIGEYEISSNGTVTEITIRADNFSTYYAVSIDAVASIGDTKYYSLQSAFDVGGDVKLLRNEFTTSTLTVKKDKIVNFDTSEFTLSYVSADANTTRLIHNAGTLIISGQGKIISFAESPDTDWNPEGFPTYASNCIANNGILTIEGDVTIENQTSGGGASYVVDNYAGAKLSVNGGKLLGVNDVAIRINTASSTAENNVEITGGEITGKRAIWIHLAGSNNEVAPTVNLTISGGKLICNDSRVGVDHLVLYSYSYGNSFTHTNVTISGGVFLDGSVQFGGGYKGDEERITISGGTFEENVLRWTASDESKVLYYSNMGQ